jgi:aldehyde:ferredoxin oxidoreductase
MSTYAGKFLRVNLTNGSITTESIPDEIKKKFIGGRGFGIHYLYREVGAEIEPLEAENKLLLLTGPLCGTTGQGFSKWVAVTKSPLTGGIARAVGGGHFGAHLKFAGFDHITVEGEAGGPVYIHIEKEKVEIRSAEDLWGLDTQKTQERLKERHGKSTTVACIGPAGEKLVRYAAIVSDRRTASRCGVGTVMGAKKLKAISIKSSGHLEPFNRQGFRDLVNKQIEFLKSNPVTQNIRRIGSLFPLEIFYQLGFYPVRNFQGNTLEDFDKLKPDEYAKLKVGNDGCYGCMTKCGQVFRVSEGLYKGVSSEGPEYETAFSFGGLIGNTDVSATIAADSLCDLFGIDTISCGSAIAFACELYQRGVITSKETDGLELTWGNHSALLSLLEKIAQREGFGRVLGEGTKKAAEQIGSCAEQYAMHVKGLEITGYEPRAIKGLGLNYATSNMGAHHMYGYHRPETSGQMDPLADEGKGASVAAAQKECAINDSIVVCNFGNPGLAPALRGNLLVAATGLQEFDDIEYLTKVGERIVTLERAFNIREGFSRKDDYLPQRMLSEPLKDAGPATGQFVRKMDTLLDEYYDAMGYTRNGIPTVDKLKELELHKE